MNNQQLAEHLIIGDYGNHLVISRGPWDKTTDEDTRSISFADGVAKVEYYPEDAKEKGSARKSGSKAWYIRKIYASEKIEKSLNELFEAAVSRDASARTLLERLTLRPVLTFFHGEPKPRPDALTIPHRTEFEDWIGLADLEKDPKLFWHVNQANLREAHHQKDGRMPKLVRKFEELLRRDPQRYRDLVRQFYLEVVPNVEPTIFNLYMLRSRDLDYSLDDPVVEFLANDPFRLFTEEEKLKFFDRHLRLEVRTIKDSTGNKIPTPDRWPREERFGAERWSQSHEEPSSPDLIRKVLGYTAPQSGGDLIALAERFTTSKSSLIKRMVILEAELFFKNRPMQNFDAVRWAQAIDRDLLFSNREIDLLKYPKLVAQCREVVARRTLWQRDVAAQVEEWVALSEGLFFPVNEQLRYERLASILDQIDNLGSPAERMRLTEKLMFAPAIKEPEIRKRTVNIWSQAVVAAEGKDTGDSAYRDRLLEILKRVSEHARAIDRAEMLRQMAEAVEAQTELSNLLEQGVWNLSRSNLEKTHLQGIVAEGLLESMKRDDASRKESIRFLLTPLTDESVEKFKEHFRITFGMADKNHEKSEEDFRIAIRQLHKNFWASSHGARSVLVAELLEVRRDSEESFLKAYHLVSEFLFPESKPIPFGAHSKLILKNYLLSLPDFARGPYLAGFLAAEPTDQTHAGRVASAIDPMGPAEKKLQQAAHSYPGPQEVRSAFRGAKKKSDVPDRWDVMELYEQRTPAEVKATIRRVNHVLGAASFWIVVEVELTNGKKAALALLRSFADERAEEGFRRIRNTISNLREDTSRMTPQELDNLAGLNDGKLLPALDQLTSQAQRSAKVETDPNANRTQHSIAENMYEGLEIKMGTDAFRYHLIPNIAEGYGFRLMEKAPGVSFNDLAEDTPENLQFKRTHAKQLAFTDLLTILRAMHTDEDRHGDQMNIEGRDIYFYDFGGITLTRPSESDINQLVEILIDSAFEAQRTRAKLGDVLFDRVQKLTRIGKRVPEYLFHIERKLLASNDVFQHLSSDDLKDIFYSLFKSPIISESVHSAMRENGSLRVQVTSSRKHTEDF